MAVGKLPRISRASSTEPAAHDRCRDDIVPHGAVRAHYVFGEREMPSGAVPTDSSDVGRNEPDRRRGRPCRHGASKGFSTFADHPAQIDRRRAGAIGTGPRRQEELIAIGRAMGRVGHGVFEMASDLKREWNEFAWMARSAE